MSSFGLSGAVSLLRVRLALPVNVATLPIGSSAGCVSAAVPAASPAAGAGAAGVAGAAGAGCAWANCIRSAAAAKASVAPRQQMMSMSANENRRRITEDSGQRGIGQEQKGDISLAGLNAG